MPYHFIEHMADTAVEVEATTVEDLFSLACHAWRDVALESGDISSTEWKFLYFKAGSLEELLVQLLSELNLLLFTKDWVFNSVDDLKILSGNSEFKLYADVYGSPFNPEIYTIKQGIKAITYHQMKVEKMGDSIFTKIVFDI